MTLRNNRGTVVFCMQAVAVALLASATMYVVKQAHSDSAENATRSRAFWDALKVNGDEHEGYASLAEMADASDFVVRGKLSNFRISRRIHGDAVEDVVTMAVADITVSEALRGRASSKLQLEFLIPQTPDAAAKTIRELRANAPQEEAVMFLRSKGGQEAGLYRLVNSSGLWTASGSAVTAPLTTSVDSSSGSSQPAPRPSLAEAAAVIERENQARPPELRSAHTPRASPPPVRRVDAHAAEPSADQKYAQELASIHDLDDLAAYVVR